MGDLEGLYQVLILDHARLRTGHGRTADWTAEHSERSAVCGDALTMRLAIDGDRVAAVGWDGDGCSISMASASIFSELSDGRSIGEVRAAIEEFRKMLHSRGAHRPDEALIGDAVALAGVAKYPMRVKCAFLAWTAAEACLDEALRRRT